jgi:hypothetical protein
MPEISSDCQDKKNPAIKAVRVLTWVWFIPFLAAVLVLFFVSIFTTVYYDFDQQVDLPRFSRENIPLLLLLILAVLVCLYLLKNRTGVLSVWKADRTEPGKSTPLSPVMRAVLWMVTAVSLYFILFMRGIATSDAKMLDGIINQFMQGDYSALTPGGYLYANPHQLGYVAVGQLLYLLFGQNNYTVYQLLNIPAILITVWVLYQISWEISENVEISNLTAVLSAGMFCLYCYATFVYNDIWSLAPEMAALYLSLRYLKYHRLKDMAAGSVLFGTAIVLKTNCWIALIAAAVMLVLDGLRNNGFHKNNSYKMPLMIQNLLLVLLLVVLGKGMTAALDFTYGMETGIRPMPKGNAGTAYIAMGMQESGGEGGWYNGYNIKTFTECGYDTELTDQAARKYIAGRLGEFRSRPLHAARFYVRKFLSQWGDESCISLHNMEQTSRHVSGQPAILQFVLYGPGRVILRWIMNVYQTMVYLGLAVWGISNIRWRHLDFLCAFSVLYIFGGMLFHELWEASSRYILRYYVFMLPLAAMGIEILLSDITNQIRKFRKEKQQNT